MVTKVISQTEYCVHADGTGNQRQEFYGNSGDVVDNGDGSYSIPEAKDARNSAVFMAMDTGLTLMYDAEAKVWWKPFKA